MYIVSFYSFKGGVGRTMALANVGARLAQAGRKVLMVDFDLEAPGLSTYDFPKPDLDTLGVVEFVNEYLRTNRAPRVNDYLYHSPGFGKGGGDLWIMPAGLQDDGYASKFAQIDWQELYEERNGFLLLEDLKQQWEKELNPDYVLIDSRTGHSDVVGICTRQLPDAVVLMMFPNAQNLVGLRKITSDIREHEGLLDGRKIRQHFVVSNVPDLDDEDRILENTFEQFRTQLGYKKPSAIIHRYQSLALLNQDIFSVTRPRTRLAEEYKTLTDEIVLYNDEDKEGAVNYLTRALRNSGYRRIRFGARETESRVSSLREKHGDDAEILFLLGKVNARQGNEEDALELYEEAHKCGMKSTELFMAMMSIQESISDLDGALISIRKVFQCSDASYFDISNAAQMLSRIAPNELDSIADSPALLSMDAEDQVEIASRLSNIQGGFSVSEKIIDRIRGSSEKTKYTEDVSMSVMVLGLISSHRYDEAIKEILSAPDAEIEKLDIGSTFNLAMARWGLDGAPDESLFHQVVKLEDEHLNDLNYLQCLTIAHSVIGDQSGAITLLNKAKKIVAKRPVRTFSAWTYKEVNQKMFQEHLLELQNMIAEENVQPRFLDSTKE